MRSTKYTDIKMENERKEKGILYIVATPIGNLSDMSERAVEVLKSVDIIAAEDTRNSIKLLNHFEIKTPMTSYHEYNRFDKADELVDKMLNGQNIAIITDAGTPCISDPGEVLVEKCHEAGVPVTSVPGPSSVITALTLSGLSARRFVFEGFLPAVKQKKDREEALSRLTDEIGTIVLLEAPHHLLNTLSDLARVLGEDRRITLCREMTKKHEEVIRTTLKEALLLEPRGEYVLVIEGKSREALQKEKTDKAKETALSDQYEIYINEGMDKKEAMKRLAKERGMAKRDIYSELLKVKAEI